MTESEIRPFITQFATPIDFEDNETLRYDEHRQVSQVFVGGEWIDAAIAPAPPLPGSRITKVERETTDDD